MGGEGGDGWESETPRRLSPPSLFRWGSRARCQLHRRLNYDGRAKVNSTKSQMKFRRTESARNLNDPRYLARTACRRLRPRFKEVPCNLNLGPPPPHRRARDASTRCGGAGEGSVVERTGWGGTLKMPLCPIKS